MSAGMRRRMRYKWIQGLRRPWGCCLFEWVKGATLIRIDIFSTEYGAAWPHYSGLGHSLYGVQAGSRFG